jgi:hypothetical protein
LYCGTVVGYASGKGWMKTPCERWWGCWKRDAEFSGGDPGVFVHAAV